MCDEKIWLYSPHMGGKEFLQAPRDFDYIQEAFNENWIAPLSAI
jgi:hypothetical protein